MNTDELPSAVSDVGLGPVREVVVGVDGCTPEARRVLQWVARWSNSCPTLETILVVHVITERRGALGLPSAVPPDLRLERRQTALWRLRRLVGELDGRLQARAQVRIVPGEPTNALPRLAAGTDMLIIGASRRGWFSRLARPSVANACLGTSPCPVTIVPVPTTSGRRGSSRGFRGAPR